MMIRRKWRPALAAVLFVAAAAVLLRGGGPLALGSCFIGARVASVAVAVRWLERLGHQVRWRVGGWGRYVREAWPYGVTKWISASYDQLGVLCLAWLVSDAVTGAYSASFRLIDGISSLPQVLVLVLLPELTVRHGVAPSTVAPLVRKTVAYTALLTLTLTACFLIEGPWLIRTIYGAGYGASVTPFRIMALGMPFMFTTEIARTTLWALDRQRTALAVITLGVTANLAFNLWLIPQYGAAGAAMATAASGVVVWLAMWGLLARRGITWPWLEATGKPALVALIVSAALLSLHAFPWPVRALGAASIALAAAVATKAITPLEWDLLRSLPGRLVPRISRRCDDF